MDSYSVDGVPLHDPTHGWYVMEGTALPSIGEPRLASVDVPTRNGVIAPRVLSHGGATLSVKMMITGAGAGREALAENFSDLVRLVSSVTEITHYLGEDAFTRTAPARLQSVSTPAYTVDVGADDPDYECTVVFDLPRGVWAEDCVIVADSSDMTPFDGTGAALQDVVLRCVPTERRFSIADGATGATIEWEDDLVADGVLEIRPDLCEASWLVDGAYYDCSGGLTMPAEPWEITPTSHGIVTLQVAGIDAVEVEGRRSFR